MRVRQSGKTSSLLALTFAVKMDRESFLYWPVSLRSSSFEEGNDALKILSTMLQKNGPELKNSKTWTTKR